MLLGDLIYNDDFDANLNYKIFEGIWNDGGREIWNTKYNGYSKPPCSLLDKHIAYLTIDVNDKFLVIEVK